MAKQKSSLPTTKLIASVLMIPVVTATVMWTGYDPSPEELAGAITLVSAVVGYVIPPSKRDQIVEVIEDVRDAAKD